MKFSKHFMWVFSVSILFSTTATQAQIKVGDNPNTVNAASAIEVESTTKGILFPRMTATQMNAISSPPNGLMVFNTTDSCTYFYHNSWKSMCDASTIDGIEWEDVNLGSVNAIIAKQAATNGDTIIFTDDGKIGIGTSSPDGILEMLNDKSGYDSSVVFDERGHLGLGDEDPEVKLVVKDETSPIIRLYRAGNSLKADIDYSSSYLKIGTLNNDPVAFYTKNNRVMTLGTEGFVGIGETYPVGKFTVTNDVNSGFDSSFVVKKSGFVGIGESDPSAKMHIKGASGGYLFALEGTGIGATTYLEKISTNSNRVIIAGTERLGGWTAEGSFVAGGVSSDNLVDGVFTVNGISKNVGIGIYNPTSKFQINNDVSGSDSSFVVLESGYVGIGTDSPSEMLQVNGSIKMTDGNEGANKVLVSDANGVGSWEAIPTQEDLGDGDGDTKIELEKNAGEDKIRFTTNNSERMIIDNSGNVGIGTDAPETQFEVEGFLPYIQATTNSSFLMSGLIAKGNNASNSGLLQFGSSNSATFDGVSLADGAEFGAFSASNAPFVITTNSSSDLYLGTKDQTRMYFDTLGNVGVNTTNPVGTFHVNNNTTGSDSSFVILNSGEVGIGSDDPISTLDVYGSAGFAITTTATDITLDKTHRTLVITGGSPVITLPSAASAANRIYNIVNNTNGSRTISSYSNYGSNSTSVSANSSIVIQSDGSNWYRIN